MLAMTSVATPPPVEWFVTTGTTFVVIFLAELGDKTQLVCMTLAARYRGLPVVIGATLAFAVLNVLAVVFGAALTNWLPEKVLLAGVALLFAIFGINAWRSADGGSDDGDAQTRGGRSVVLNAFLLIFLAELGDKTQIAVAGLAVSAPPVPVWLGATFGLGFSAVLAVWVGRTFLQRLPMKRVHQAGGVVFLLLAGAVLVRLIGLGW